jgi:hypothetical protein
MKTKRSLFQTNHGWVLLVLVLHAGAFSACTTGIGEHISTYRHLRTYAKENKENRDLSRERISESGLYRAIMEPQVDPIPLSQLHTWRLQVEYADHRSLENATITVDGGMPAHGHGLPTKPQVTCDLGGGAYLVEGMKFQMPGWWVVQFHISSPEGADTVSFNLML